MNTDSACCSRATWNWIGILGAFLVMAVLVAALKHYTSTPAANYARAAERHKFLAETRQKTSEELTSPLWIDKEKGVVRLPNDVAAALVVKQWQDPAKARSNLLERADKAFFIPPPPPPPPEPKNPFE